MLEDIGCRMVTGKQELVPKIGVVFYEDIKQLEQGGSVVVHYQALRTLLRYCSIYCRPTSGISVFCHSANQISFSSQKRPMNASNDSAANTMSRGSGPSSSHCSDAAP